MTTQTRDIRTAEDLLALRADEDFNEGALAVLTYPTAPPAGYIGYDNPKGAFGRRIEPAGEQLAALPLYRPAFSSEPLIHVRTIQHPGTRVTKGEAGDFETETIS